MPKPTKGPRLGGGPAHERLLLANLAAALFTHKSITTTETKAKRLRPLAERLITFAKRGDLHARRRVLSVIGDKEVVHVLFTEIAPLVAEREGGYTRITKVGNRKGDNAPLAVIELVLEPVVKKKSAAPAADAPKATKKKGRKKRLLSSNVLPGLQPYLAKIASYGPVSFPRRGALCDRSEELPVRNTLGASARPQVSPTPSVL